MLTDPLAAFKKQKGVTLIELIVFITVTAVIAVSLSAVFQQAMSSLNQPIVNNQLTDMARSQLNAVLSRRFDENSPTDGTPCGVVIPCAGFGLDAGESLSDITHLDDVDDFDGYSDNPRAGFSRTVRVSQSGASFGIAQSHAKRIDVTVSSTAGDSLVLTAYKVNH